MFRVTFYLEEQEIWLEHFLPLILNGLDVVRRISPLIIVPLTWIPLNKQTFIVAMLYLIHIFIHTVVQGGLYISAVTNDRSIISLLSGATRANSSQGFFLNGQTLLILDVLSIVMLSFTAYMYWRKSIIAKNE
ncbi:MAG: hypothetical protein FWG67_06430 [Defluviitaleaceae bacterium]|nr:hypothetical protein [Defluviitaleaceae bacterium]